MMLKLQLKKQKRRSQPRRSEWLLLDFSVAASLINANLNVSWSTLSKLNNVMFSTEPQYVVFQDTLSHAGLLEARDFRL